MKEIPNVITLEDLILIQKLLDTDLLMNNKLNKDLKCIKDNDIKNFYLELINMHKSHYNYILNLLK